MNEKKALYIIIALLLITNVIVLFSSLGRNFSYFPVMGTGMLGRYFYSSNNNQSDSDWKSHMNDFDTWDQLVRHMQEEHSDIYHRSINTSVPAVETHKSTHDFGKVSKSNGTVSTVFVLENHGKTPLEFSNLSTSCGCTTAELSNSIVNSDETTNLTVTFDPNIHDEPVGRFKRSVFVKTNDPAVSEMHFDIFIEIID